MAAYEFPHVPTENSRLLVSFIQYCDAHPTERFWQALRNWCGWNFIFVSQKQYPYYDTYYWKETRAPD